MAQQLRETFWQRHDKIIGPALAEDFEKIGQQDTRDALEAYILEHSGPATRVLDAGCNTSVEGYRLFRKNFPGVYHGVDSNLKALQFAMQNNVGNTVTYQLADIADIQYPDAYFDIVFSKDVIEHAEHYRDILPELCRLSRDHFILAFFIKPEDEPDDIQPHEDGYFLNRYDRRELLDLVKQCGFGRPEQIFENSTDEILVFRRVKRT